jgi:hypothetical protein
MISTRTRTTATIVATGRSVPGITTDWPTAR